MLLCELGLLVNEAVLRPLNAFPDALIVLGKQRIEKGKPVAERRLARSTVEEFSMPPPQPNERRVRHEAGQGGVDRWVPGTKDSRHQIPEPLLVLLWQERDTASSQSQEDTLDIWGGDEIRPLEPMHNVQVEPWFQHDRDECLFRYARELVRRFSLHDEVAVRWW